MMLLVDIGNSSIKWATLELGALSSQQRIWYQNANFEEMLEKAWGQLESVEGIWVSNVAGPQKAEILAHWIKDHFGRVPTFVKTSHAEGGIKNGYQNPEQLGVDRWLALIGAYALKKDKLCVVDCGTAITLDVLSANGQHLGGLIIPGVATMHKALKNNTYALDFPVNKMLPFHEKQPLLAHDTQTGIALGTSYAVIGFVEYVINTFENQGDKLKICLTGGGTSTLEPFLQRGSYQYIPDLVLQGLVVLVNQSL
jgi:type III pantothenate kinase